jgi:hypothetical protein
LAQRIARLLEAAGFEVWWDRRIPAGKSYRNVLEEELRAADLTVVLWSRNSVGSDWVKEEAEQGRNAGKLMPVLIERRPEGNLTRPGITAKGSKWRKPTS